MKSPEDAFPLGFFLIRKYRGVCLVRCGNDGALPSGFLIVEGRMDRELGQFVATLEVVEFDKENELFD